MPLPTVADVKAYLRVESNAEDALIALILQRARGAVEAYLGRPIVAVEREFTIEEPGELLMLSLYPVSATGFSVVDMDGNTVDPAEYRVGLQTGIVKQTGRVSWWYDAPYTVTATVGLELHPDYATVIEPVLSAAIIDTCADLYHNRNPLVQTETSAGASKTLATYLANEKGNAGLPPRVARTLDRWRIGPRIS